MKRSVVRSLFMMLLIFGSVGNFAEQLEAMADPALEDHISVEERDVEPYRSAAPKRFRARRSDSALQPAVQARLDSDRDSFARMPQRQQPTSIASTPILRILRI